MPPIKTITIEHRFASPHNRRWYYAAATVLLLGATLAARCDLWAATRINLDAIPGDLRRSVSLSEAYSHGFGAFVILLAILITAPHLRRFVPRLAACAVLPGLAADLIKVLVIRQRPNVLLEQSPMTASPIGWFPGTSDEQLLNFAYGSQSFPSGHTAMAFGLAVGLSWLFPRGRYLFFALAILASFQRLVSNAHWLSDVLAGAALGIFIAGSMLADRWFFYRLENRSQTVADKENSPAVKSAA